jgi:cytochrome P450
LVSISSSIPAVLYLTSATAIPHRLTEDDVYDGYLIPGGATVIGNSWAILHDPEVYTDPETFRPERFLQPDTEDQFPDATFGFGRRVCPGQHMARSTVWIAIASVLSSFEITPARDGEGKEIPIIEEYTNGVVS